MIRRAWVLGGLLALSPAASQAALLMLVDGVTGNSTLTGYAGFFNLGSLQWNIDRSGTTPHAVHVTLEVSANTALLHHYAANGTIVKRIAIDQVAQQDTSVQLMARYICEEPVIRSTSTSHHADQRGVIALDIRCTRLAWEYFDYAVGKTLSRQAKGSWNFKTNTP
jgi:hypothetical protein